MEALPSNFSVYISLIPVSDSSIASTRENRKPIKMSVKTEFERHEQNLLYNGLPEATDHTV